MGQGEACEGLWRRAAVADRRRCPWVSPDCVILVARGGGRSLTIIVCVVFSVERGERDRGQVRAGAANLADQGLLCSLMTPGSCLQPRGPRVTPHLDAVAAVPSPGRLGHADSTRGLLEFHFYSLLTLSP